MDKPHTKETQGQFAPSPARAEAGDRTVNPEAVCHWEGALCSFLF